MVWETKNQQRRTLYIQKLSNGKFKIEQFLDVYDKARDMQLREPIPAETMGLRYMEFDEVAFIEHPSIDRTLTAGQDALINTNSKGLQSRTAPA